jgi:hypothetical protein
MTLRQWSWWRSGLGSSQKLRRIGHAQRQAEQSAGFDIMHPAPYIAPLHHSLSGNDVPSRSASDE